MTANVTGLEQVMRNLNKEIAGIEERTLKGLIEAQIIIRRDMDTTSPMIPVDLNNLRASYFTVTTSGKGEQSSPTFKGEAAGKLSESHGAAIAEANSIIALLKSRGPALVMGFTAFYAWFVHEMVGANFQRPGSGAKFMEAAIKRNYNNIIATVKKFARVK